MRSVGTERDALPVYMSYVRLKEGQQLRLSARLMSTYQTSRCHNPEDHNMDSHHFDVLRPYENKAVLVM